MSTTMAHMVRDPGRYRKKVGGGGGPEEKKRTAVEVNPPLAVVDVAPPLTCAMCMILRPQT